MPENAPDAYKDRSTLWNSVEQSEKAKNAQLARTIKADLPNDWSYELAGDKKKFRSDLLQRNYAQWADFFGESERSVRAAIVTLENLGVIKRVFRTVEMHGAHLRVPKRNTHRRRRTTRIPVMMTTREPGGVHSFLY